MKEDEGSLGSISRVPKLETYADLVSKIKEKDLLFMNVGYGRVQSCTKGSEKNAPSLFEQHKTFINFIKTKSEEELKGAGPGIPLYLLSYSHPPAFQTPEDLKEFYIHRLGEKFKIYEAQFQEVFDHLK